MHLFFIGLGKSLLTAVCWDDNLSRSFSFFVLNFRSIGKLKNREKGRLAK